MSNSSAPVTVAGQRYWIVLLARAVPAAFVALFITFSADHSVGVGWLSLAVFGVLSGALIAIGSAWMLRGLSRTLLAIQGIALALVGIVSAFGTVTLPVTAFIAALAVGFVISGAFELVAGLRGRGATTVARDWVFLGGASIVFGLAVLLIPTDLSQAITVPDKDVPNLTASVVAVGALGAYAAIVAVYSGIAGLSFKWAKHPEARVDAEGVA